MGNRAIIIFYDEGRISPCVYLHWNGNDVPDLIGHLAEYMKGRYGDAEYAAARFTGLCHDRIGGNMGLGISSNELKHVDLDNAEVLREMSPGDGGLVVVNAGDFSWKAYGGYLAGRRQQASARLTLIETDPHPSTTPIV